MSNTDKNTDSASDELRQRQDQLYSLVRSMTGLDCWYVSVGAVGTTFQLALGKKVPRRIPIKNPDHPDEYRQFEGEANLLVWCSWRLDAPAAPVTSSDDIKQAVDRGLRNLIGAKIESVDLCPPAWDLSLRFSNGLKLRIFCDHVPGEPSFDGNWELWREDVAVFIRPGAGYDLEPRNH